MIFSGNANEQLAHAVANHLGIPLGKRTAERFSDGEIMVEILENVRGRDVFVLQPTCAPANENFMELLILVDAFKRASAQSITAVIGLIWVTPDKIGGPVPAESQLRRNLLQI